MKKHFSVFLIVFFITTNLNAEIAGVNISNLTQLYNNQISKILIGKKHLENLSIGRKKIIDLINYKNDGKAAERIFKSITK